MKCPQCVQRIHRTASVCPHCGYSLEEAERLFEGEAVALRCLADGAGLLTRDERRRIEGEIARFGAKFPQLFFAVRTMTMRDSGCLRQFGFWLLNRAVFEDLAEGLGNDGGLLLVIDAESRAATLTYGYRLDPYLAEGDTFGCLSKAHSFLLEGDYARGIEVVARGMGRVLRRRYWRAKWSPRRFASAGSNPARAGELVKRIRFGREVGGEAGGAEA